jgi:ABC-2 type transport system permease protein
MFASILRFEFRYWLRNPAFYFYLLIFFFLAFILMGGSAGLFGTVANGRLANSPFSLYSFLTLFTKLILFLLPAIIGNSIYRDFKSRSFQIMYTFPFTRWDYLCAKFLSSFAIVLIVSAFAGLGLYAATQLPGVDKNLLAEFNLAVYLKLYGVYLLPNIFLFGSIVFSIVALSRNVYTGFIAVVVMLIGRELLSRLAINSESEFALLAEPLGEAATLFVTKEWTVVEQNINSIPVLSIILLNRFVWFSFACIILIFTYQYFSFTQLGLSFSSKIKATSRISKNSLGNLAKVSLSTVRFSFNWHHYLRVIWRLSQEDFKFIVRSGSFLSILLAGSILVIVLLFQMNPPYETRILPVTWVMLAFPIFFFSLLINFLTFLYAGILIDRGRTTRMSELVDVTPVSNGVFVVSKLIALIKMQLVLLAVNFLAGIGAQVYAGYYQFEVVHYLFDLLAIHLTGFVIWAIAAVFVQTIISNTYVGLFILILGFFGVSQLQQLGISSLVFQFNQDIEPGFFIKYSDMNGHGHSLLPYFILKGYWLLLGLVLIIGAVIAWLRGTAQGVHARIVLAGKSLSGKWKFAFIASFFLVVAAGFTLHWFNNSSIQILNESQRDRIAREADVKYGYLKDFVQPRIVNVEVVMHLYPENQTFESSGVFTLVNRTNKYIDTLLVNYSQDAFTKYKFDKEYEVLRKDSVAKFDINRLRQSLAPGDSLHLHFEVHSIPNNWLYQNSPVLANGTFITSLIHPGLGYYTNSRQPNFTDSMAQQNHYRSIDSDYISFGATVSTSGDQRAITTGYLTKEWQKNGRNFFQYQSTTKVTNDYAFTSGRYDVMKGKYQDVDIEIYYHPSHTYNLTHLMNGMKATFDYCEKNFSPYQHKQIRVIEYARKAGDFAQSFANMIPVSERSFVMDIDDTNPHALNLSFLGASHELAHQWWGHQVIPAALEGSRFITESMAEYISLCVLEQHYGKEKGKLFRRKALDIYLKRRADDEDEKPLMSNSGLDKPYIPYQKGAMALYALRDFIGEEKVNAALRSYLEEVKFQQAPYTTSVDLVSSLRKATPDSLRYLIHDLFETVTLYSNRLEDYQVETLTNGKHKVTIDFIVTKFYTKKGIKVFADNDGQSLTQKIGQSELHSLPLKDFVEVGVYSSTGEEIYLRKHFVNQIKNRVIIELDKAPSRVAVDPLVKLIDIHSDG